jgi:hypothetical protein
VRSFEILSQIHTTNYFSRYQYDKFIAAVFENYFLEVWIKSGYSPIKINGKLINLILLFSIYLNGKLLLPDVDPVSSVILK